MPERDRQFYAAYENKRKTYERKYFKAFGSAMYLTISDFLAAMNQSALTPEQAIDLVETKFTKKHIEKVYYDLYEDVAVRFAVLTYESLMKSRKKTKAGGVSDFLAFVSNFLKTNAATRITSIEESIKADLRSILSFGSLQGWSIDKLTDLILELRVGFESYRAQRIARTEIVSASNYGSREGARATGFNLMKEWIATSDSRTRRTPEDQFDHSDMNNVAIPEGEYFQVPKRGGGYELLELPGDHNGSAGNVVNCRCTIAWIPLD